MHKIVTELILYAQRTTGWLKNVDIFKCLKHKRQKLLKNNIKLLNYHNQLIEVILTL